jgi:very-short-patch-repair endonuclease
MKKISIPEETFALHCRADDLHPHREYKFHPVRKWRFDFAFLDMLVAVEIEGGVWSGGRHGTGTGFTADCEKYNEAALLGWRILRFTPDMVKSGYAIGTTKELLKREEEIKK